MAGPYSNAQIISKILEYTQRELNPLTWDQAYVAAQDLYGISDERMTIIKNNIEFFNINSFYIQFI